jgi:hypothetical protein
MIVKVTLSDQVSGAKEWHVSNSLRRFGQQGNAQVLHYPKKGGCWLSLCRLELRRRHFHRSFERKGAYDRAKNQPPSLRRLQLLRD